MKSTFVIITSAGVNRDFSKDTREQPFWDEHAEFIDRLVDEGFIFMGGHLIDEGGSLLIVNAEDENEVREKMKKTCGMNKAFSKSTKRWQIFIDERKYIVVNDELLQRRLAYGSGLIFCSNS